MSTINIHVSLSKFSLPYFDYMIKNYRSMTTKHELQFFAHCMDKCELEASRLTPNVISLPRHQYSSEGHANSIHSALQLGKTLKGINLIADNDTVILAKGWDEITTSILEKVGVFGSTFERISQDHSEKRQMYKDKPTITWFAMSPNYDFSRIDASPEMTSDIPITNQQLSDLYCLPIGYSLFRDTGWRIPSYLQINNIPYRTLALEKPLKSAIAVKTKNDYNEEFQLDGVPFVAHQRGSRKRIFRQATESVVFYNACEEYIKIKYNV